MRYSKDELSAIIERELRQSLGGDDSEVVAERLRNLQFYEGRAEGELSPPDTPDRSSIVATDVADTVEWMLPALVRVFSQSPESMECVPVQQQYAPQAKLASEYLRHVFWHKNNGFLTTYEWFKTALVQKVGWVKVYFDDQPTDSQERYRGLLSTQVEELLSAPGVTVVEQSSRTVMVEAEGEQPGMPEQAIPVEVFDLVLARKASRKKCVVEGVPPEEMRIHRRARYGKEPLFIAQERWETKADLEAAGYDLEGVSTGTDWTEEEIERQSYQSNYFSDGDQGELQRYRVSECYIKLDQDNDGVPEWRRVLMIGSTIMEDEKTDDHPFVPFCPNPSPHVFVGKCPADFAVEPQRLNTSLLRGLMDNVYLSVNQRMGVVDGMVNLDDLTQNRPGGIVRMREAGALVPIPQNGLDQGAWQMVEWGEQWRERRTGFTRYSQGMSPDALNPTATGVGIITEKADQRVELIARVAAVSMEQMFRKILKCVTTYQDVPEVVEMMGQWVEIDPREWCEGFDIRINPALGTGSKDKKALVLQQVFGMQQPLVQAGMLPPQAVVTTGRAFADAAGLGEPEQFFPDPPPPQPMQPPPQLQIKQMELQADAQKFQAQSQMDAARIQMEAQLQQASKQAELEVQRANDERDSAREQLRMQMEAEQREQDRAAEMQKALIAAAAQIQMAQMKTPEAETPMDQAAILMSLQQTMQALQESISRPRVVVRGPDNRIVGVQ